MPEITSGRTGTEVEVTMTVNGRVRRVRIEPRKTLADTLREDLGLTGTHLGCEHGVCGACTIFVDGEAVRACLMLGVQVQDAEVTTIEGLAPDAESLTPVQRAFRECHGLQCGFCTPGFIMSTTALLEANPDPSDEEIRAGLSGNLCRCTGYQGIVRAVKQAAGAGEHVHRQDRHIGQQTAQETGTGSVSHLATARQTTTGEG
jgi:aerobic carbon-monoxide dehydrogenase small subunit